MWERISDKLQNGKIPSSYKSVIATQCPVCGKPRVGNDNLTEIKCVDYYCIKYTKERAKFMFDYLGVSGIGPETAEVYIKTHQVKSHVDLIPYVFKDKKPSLYLWEIAKITCVPGLSDKMEKIFGGYNRFEDYFREEYNVPPAIRAFKDKLIKYQDYFKIKPCLSKNSIKVMITGHVNGYANKRSYVDWCNEYFGHIVKTEMCKSVKARFVLTEDPNSGTDKLDMARQRRIPVITPSEYKVYLLSRLNPSNPELMRVAKELEGRFI